MLGKIYINMIHDLEILGGHQSRPIECTQGRTKARQIRGLPNLVVLPQHQLQCTPGGCQRGRLVTIGWGKRQVAPVQSVLQPAMIPNWLVNLMFPSTARKNQALVHHWRELPGRYRFCELAHLWLVRSRSPSRLEAWPVLKTRVTNIGHWSDWSIRGVHFSESIQHNAQ